LFSDAEGVFLNEGFPAGTLKREEEEEEGNSRGRPGDLLIWDLLTFITEQTAACWS